MIVLCLAFPFGLREALLDLELSSTEFEDNGLLAVLGGGFAVRLSASDLLSFLLLSVWCEDSLFLDYFPDEKAQVKVRFRRRSHFPQCLCEEPLAV